MSHVARFLCVTMLLGAAACSNTTGTDVPVDPGPTVQTLNVPYAPAPPGTDPNLLSLDIHRAERAQRAPVVVFIHGGGWQNGDKRNVSIVAPTFVDAGFVAVFVNYRLSPPALHPDHVNDVAKALAWVHDRIAQYGGDPQRIFVAGHSAGGHLAGLVAADERRLGALGKPLRLLAGAVLLDAAAFDIPRYLTSPNATAGMRALIEQAFGTSEAVWRDASITTHVAPAKCIAPMLIVYGGAQFDSAVQAPELAGRLTAAGSPSEALQVNKSHEAIGQDLAIPTDPMTQRVLGFLRTTRNPCG